MYRKISSKLIKDFIFAVLLLTPQISIRFGGVIIDTSIVLLFILMFIFLSKKRIGYQGYKFFLLLFLFIILLVIQSYYNDESLIQGLLVMDEGREIGTFGSYRMHNVDFLNYKNIRLIGIFCFTFLIGYRFENQNLLRIKEILLMTLFTGCVVQLTIILFDLTGFLNSFIMKFMVDNVTLNGEIHQSFLTNRYNLKRYSAGFSEPSFFASVIWIILSGIYMLRKENYIHFTNKEIYFIAFSVIFFVFTTISMFMLLCLFLVIVIFYNLSTKKTLIVMSIGILLVHFLPLLMDSIFFANIGLSSVINRVFLTTNIFDLSLHSIFWGTQIGYIYSNPPFTALILQVGVIYLLFFMIIILWNIPNKFYIILFGLYVLLVCPNIAIPYFFLSMFLLSTISYQIKKNKIILSL